MNRMIRQELPKDYKTTEEVVKQAFLNEQYSDGKEHQLVNRIRKSKAFIPELSLVAIGEDKAMIGHILLSKISIVNNDQSVESLALAPVSVVPQYQKKGIGSQ